MAKFNWTPAEVGEMPVAIIPIIMEGLKEEEKAQKRATSKIKKPRARRR